MDPQAKLRRDVKKFLEVYRILSAQGRAQFEARMAAQLKDQDKQTGKLYRSLLQAAENGENAEEAIKKMGQVS